MKFIGHALQTEDSQIHILTDGQQTCTYQELPDIFTQLEAFFAQHGIRQDAGLVLKCENSVPCALVLLFLLEHGYSFLPIPKLSKTAQATAALPSLPTFCQYVLTPEIQGATDVAALRNPAGWVQIVKNERWTGEHQIPDRGQLYLRTSGSTGTPKLAVHAHGKLAGNGLNCVERLQLTSTDRIAIPVPLFHMFGLGAGFLPGVAVEASIDLQRGANLLRYLQREREFQPNVAFMSPIFCETLVKGRRSARPYRLTVSAGDRFRGETFSLYESLSGILVNLYGSTEMGAISASRSDDPFEFRSITAGLPMSGVQVRLEQGNVEAAEDAQGLGELWCRHDYGFSGYIDEHGASTGWNLEEHDGWFHTRDLGQIEPDGRLKVFGRCDHSVNRDGLLVFFADVEKAIEKIDGVASAVVVAKGESKHGKGMVAYCVPAQGATITDAEIRSACFDRLPKRAVPDAVVVVKSLPLLPNGKVDRQQLSKMDEQIT